jgi:hypothetical protein
LAGHLTEEVLYRLSYVGKSTCGSADLRFTILPDRPLLRPLMEVLAELPGSVWAPRKRILHSLRTPMTRALATASAARNRGSQLETMPHSAAGSAALPPGLEQPC